MPRSKRNKVVSLTKTTDKGKDHKSKLIANLRDFVDEFRHIFVFSYSNLKGTKFRDIRFHWRESKIFLGKHSISKLAFGKNPEDEFKDNLRHVSNLLEGEVGVLFTSREPSEVIEFFKDFQQPEYAKAGEIATEDVVLPIGPLALESFATSMLDQFRKLGLIVEIDDGRLILREAFIAARIGVPLTPEQAKVLTHFKKPLAIFKIKLECHWTDGEFKMFEE